MPRRVLQFTLTAFVLSIVAGCDVLGGIAPAPASTALPTETAPPAATPTLMPTMGPREYVDAAYCWESHVDVGEFELLRFFPDGTIIDVFVQPFADCQDAWKNMAGYLTTGEARKFNHGEYYLSGDALRLELAKPNSDEIVGEVTGKYGADKLILYKQGAEEWEFVRVSDGN